ncbi:MAG: DHHA1 domain-containing protein [Planctomycetaceae bacterium]|nr:DHHA1 domain-containing protein [Planctomycetaceae bacterium]
MINWQRFKEIIDSSSTVVLTAHLRPDGDCLGNEMAMYAALTFIGKEVRIVNPQRTPPNLSYIDPANKIKALEDLTAEERQWMDTASLHLVLDTMFWVQLGPMAEVFRNSNAKCKAVIDHHENGDDIGAEDFVNSDAVANGVLVFEAIRALGIPFTKEIADPVFTAIATDTGWFRFAGVDGDTFRIAADLLDVGVVPSEIYRLNYEQESLGKVRLTGRILSNVEVHFDNKVYFTYVLQDDFEKAGALPSDTEDVINTLLRIQDSKMAVLMSELKDGTFKISFRSRCEVDCSKLARQFSGGGHKAAAGASSSESFEETKKNLLAAIEKELEQLCSGYC